MCKKVNFSKICEVGSARKENCLRPITMAYMLQCKESSSGFLFYPFFLFCVGDHEIMVWTWSGSETGICTYHENKNRPSGSVCDGSLHFLPHNLTLNLAECKSQSLSSTVFLPVCVPAILLACNVSFPSQSAFLSFCLSSYLPAACIACISAYLP